MEKISLNNIIDDSATKPLDKTLEEYRLEALHHLEILDSLPEQNYDDIVRLATALTQTPMAAISLVDDHRQWFKARIGLPACETAKDISFCQHVVETGAPMVINNALLDTRFKENPLVTGELNLRFYAGFPLTTWDGFILGSLCVISNEPGSLSANQFESMESLARQVSALLESRRQASQIESQDTELNQQREQMDQILSHLHDAVWLRDQTTGQMIFVSQGYERIWEQNTSSVLKQSSALLNSVYPEDAERVKLSFHQQALGSHEELFRIVTPAGVCKWILSRSFPIRNEQGDVVRIAGICTDVTQKLNQEQLVAEHKSKMMQSARLSSLGEMAAGIAHEINNPLAIIHGTAQMLSKTLNSGIVNVGVLNQYISRIEKTAARIGKIVSGLRSFARDGEREPFSFYPVQTIVEDTLELCMNRFSNNGIELKLDMPESEISIECRPVQVSQILANLLNNAYDAVIEQEEKWIQLTLTENEGSVMISVTDSGYGIPKEFREKLMQPFFTTKEPGKGMGLGLSLSRGIADGHQGSLRLMPDSPRTQFELALPKRQRMTA